MMSWLDDEAIRRLSELPADDSDLDAVEREIHARLAEATQIHWEYDLDADGLERLELERTKLMLMLHTLGWRRFMRQVLRREAAKESD